MTGAVTALLTKKVMVYLLDGDFKMPSSYGFDTRIKVEIFDELYIRLEDIL